MPPFRFRLQTLERLRDAARNHCREQLADALRVDELLRAQEEQLRTNLKLARGIQVVPAGKVDVDRLLEAQRYEGAVLVEIQHVMNQRARVTEELERRREALVEADREVKVLEKLKAARRAEHDQAERRAEVKRLDEAAGRIRSEEVEA